MALRLGSRKQFIRYVCLLLLAAVFIFASRTVHAEVKALIITSNYELTVNPLLALANPIADGRKINKALLRAGVSDITIVEEPFADDWNEKFELFANSLGQDDIAFFYFAGHGIQISGTNYFLTSDGFSLIPLDPMISALTDRAKATVVIIDACRNNPFLKDKTETTLRLEETGGQNRSFETITMTEVQSSQKGLAQLANLRGLSAVVFFSTDPGNVAEDGDVPGQGSPFARAFAKQLTKRQSLDETFRKTAIAVNDKTKGRQSPWRQGDLPFNVFVAGKRHLPIP